LGYETKVALKAVGRIIKILSRGKDDKEPYKEVYNEVSAIANAEGVVLEPFEESEKL